MPKARVAILDGIALAPSQQLVKDNGQKVTTLWGELAWQLLGEGGGAGIAVHSSSAVGPAPAPLRSAGAGPTAEQGQRQDAACDLTGTA
ncbi:hypothetical protein [Halochromatium glycolicum]|uniref:hypothetical protein n=1 Tax=Halochromatium glycolicum TaxID=85075 RepID=UPI001F5B7FCD|nr:hypothetical protein [Halochromatium glycolicum]